MNPLLRQRESRVPVKRIWLKQMGRTDQLHQLPGALSRSIKHFQVNLGWSSPSDSDLFFSFISCDLIPAGWNPEQDQPVTTEISIHIYFVGWNFFSLSKICWGHFNEYRPKSWHIMVLKHHTMNFVTHNICVCEAIVVNFAKSCCLSFINRTRATYKFLKRHVTLRCCFFYSPQLDESSLKLGHNNLE